MKIRQTSKLPEENEIVRHCHKVFCAKLLEVTRRKLHPWKSDLK